MTLDFCLRRNEDAHKAACFPYSGNVNENLTTLYDMVTEMGQELKTVSRSLEDKLNETEKELKDVTEGLWETKRKLNATEKKLNTGGTH